MRRRVLVTLATIGGVILVAALAAPANALTRFVACDQGDNLQESVDAAAAGDALILTGHCRDVSIVDKDLSLLGFFTTTPIIGPGFAGGPAVYVSGANVTLENLELEPTTPFHGNQGLVVRSGTVSARHVLIDRGVAAGFSGFDPVGGGIQVDQGASVTLEESTILNSRASDAGGAIYNAGSLIVRRSTISGNTSTNREGGGIHNTSTGSVLIEDSTISGSVNHRVGGGLYNAGTAHVWRSTLSGNRADHAGGGISNAGDLYLDDSALLDNRAVSHVEAVYPVGGALSMGPGAFARIRNSTISGNHAKAGGAIWNDDASIDMRAVTVSGNSAEEGGPAVSGTIGTIWIESSVLAANTSAAGAAGCGGDVTWVSDGGNFRSPGCGPDFPGPGDLVGTDPRLAEAADNGGPTFTMRPLTHSPVVGEGRCIELLARDQRQVARPTSRCDAGAYENRPPAAPGVPALADGTSPNRGDFTLGWGASTDPDGDAVTYDIHQRHGRGGGLVGERLSGPTLALTGQAEASLQYYVSATDGNEFQSSDWSATIVVDRTPPAAPAITADRAPEHADGEGANWYRDEVVVDVAPGADPPLWDGSHGSGTVSPVAAQHTFDSAGAHEVSERSIDAVGNTSAPASLVVHVDTSAPEVALGACPAQARLGATESVGWTASDTGSGLTGPESGSVALDTSSVGAKTVRVGVADRVGHVSETTCDYAVVYAFTGFEAPLKAAHPALNPVGIGQTVPVRFSLGGDLGLDVLAGAPTLTPISCQTAQPSGEPRVTIAQRPLSYDASKRQYTFWWQTLREWKKTCAQFALALDDGTVQQVNASFR